MRAFYNDIDPFACGWLQQLMDAGLITPGRIDDRSIADLGPADVAGYERVHLFAGMGGWDLALQLAGWTGPVWTASCPCPPFSAAGKKKPCPACGGSNPVPCPRRTGFFICCLCSHAWLADERHLWPEVWRLRAGTPPRERPPLLGEQIASADGRTWLAAVRASLEILGDAVRGADLPAAGVGAPHRRQRLWFVAHATDAHRGPGECGTETGIRANGERWRGLASGGADGVLVDAERERGRCGESGGADAGHAGLSGQVSELGDTLLSGLEGHPGDERDGSEPGRERADATGSVTTAGAVSELANSTDGGHQSLAGLGGVSGAEAGDDALPEPRADGTDRSVGDTPSGGRGELQPGGEHGQQPEDGGVGPWSSVLWLPCWDGKVRPVPAQSVFFVVPDAGDAAGSVVVSSGDPGDAFPLAQGVPNRVGLLRCAGNAINPWVAAAFIRAYRETAE